MSHGSRDPSRKSRLGFVLLLLLLLPGASCGQKENDPLTAKTPGALEKPPLSEEEWFRKILAIPETEIDWAEAAAVLGAPPSSKPRSPALVHQILDPWVRAARA